MVGRDRAPGLILKISTVTQHRLCLITVNQYYDPFLIQEVLFPETKHTWDSGYQPLFLVLKNCALLGFVQKHETFFIQPYTTTENVC